MKGDMPVFPRQEKHHDGSSVIYHGLSERDYIAIQAMQGLISGACNFDQEADAKGLMSASPQLAEASYVIADALIKQSEDE